MKSICNLKMKTFFFSSKSWLLAMQSTKWRGSSNTGYHSKLSTTSKKSSALFCSTRQSEIVLSRRGSRSRSFFTSLERTVFITSLEMHEAPPPTLCSGSATMWLTPSSHSKMKSSTGRKTAPNLPSSSSTSADSQRFVVPWTGLTFWSCRRVMMKTPTSTGTTSIQSTWWPLLGPMAISSTRMPNIQAQRTTPKSFGRASFGGRLKKTDWGRLRAQSFLLTRRTLWLSGASPHFPTIPTAPRSVSTRRTFKPGMLSKEPSGSSRRGLRLSIPASESRIRLRPQRWSTQLWSFTTCQ